MPTVVAASLATGADVRADTPVPVLRRAVRRAAVKPQVIDVEHP
ncbi:hypothetical protein OMK64_18330 [Cellulomonas fimi]|nr:hypothetical protein [Cellulomonas fimi]